MRCERVGPRHDACTDDAVMGRRVRLGRAFGVEIAVDSSWVFALILAAWTLVAVADHALPTASAAVVTLVGAFAAIGVFASLAVHEIAHGLGARACGVPVQRLTLFLIGGITDVEHAPSSPRSESVAAVIALLTNAIAGGALIAAAAALGDSSGAFGLLVRWLGAANIGIAALNLLPAFPLDAGRVVRAALWRVTGDVERATRWSAWVGEMIGWSIMLAGVVLAFVSHGDRVAGAMWIAFVGWFLTSAAAQAYAGVVTGDAGVSGARWPREALESRG
jgi:Zn-dependent protease